MRRTFADETIRHMEKDSDIWVLVGDLGYKMWDAVRDTYPSRFLNCGASEQAMLDIAVGLAQGGKKPIVYTATSFLLYRPYETIRNYINHENTHVILAGSGRDRDYEHDGWSHWAQDDREIIAPFKNISAHWPDTKEQIPDLLTEALASSSPYYINLRR